MLLEKWKKILSLVQKTGDKVIVFDERGENPVVIMPLDQYDELIDGSAPSRGLTEDEMLDRINQDIAQWQAVQEDALPRKIEENKIQDEDEERYYVEPAE